MVVSVEEESRHRTAAGVDQGDWRNQTTDYFEDDGDREHHRVQIHFILAPAGPKILKAQ
jgi:hypothetical protein